MPVPGGPTKRKPRRCRIPCCRYISGVSEETFHLALDVPHQFAGKEYLFLLVNSYGHIRTAKDRDFGEVPVVILEMRRHVPRESFQQVQIVSRSQIDAAHVSQGAQEREQKEFLSLLPLDLYDPHPIVGRILAVIARCPVRKRGIGGRYESPRPPADPPAFALCHRDLPDLRGLSHHGCCPANPVFHLWVLSSDELPGFDCCQPFSWDRPLGCEFVVHVVLLTWRVLSSVFLAAILSHVDGH